MRTDETPGTEDTVVREEIREGRRVYVLHRAGGPDQYLVRTREEAVRHAVTFANSQGGRAWLTGQTQAFVPLNKVRAPDSWAPGKDRDGPVGLRPPSRVPRLP